MKTIDAFAILIWMLTVILIAGVGPGAALAMTDVEYRALLEESADFQRADGELNEMWRRIMALADLPDEDRAAIRASQKAWVENVRDSAAELIRDASGKPLAECYAMVTRDRVDVLAAWMADRSRSGPAGVYMDDGMGYLAVRQTGPGAIEFDVYTVWPPQHCSGLIEKAEAGLGGQTAVYFGEDCDWLQLTFEAGRAVVEEDGDCAAHGFNCRFDGVYEKLP